MKISRTLRGAVSVSTIALTSCLALTGCGSETPGAPEAKDAQADASAGVSTGASLEEAKAVVLDYLTKGFVGDAAACEHESAEYSAAENQDSGAEDCAERVEAIKVMLTDGEPLIDISGSKITVTAGENGIAVVDLADDEQGFRATYHLTRQGSTWLIAFRPADDSSAQESEDEGAGGGVPGARQVTDAEAEEIAARFCAVKVGTARGKVEKVLGEPASERVDDDGTDEVDWRINQDSYTVWFDGGKVAQYSSSSPREGDPCE